MLYEVVLGVVGAVLVGEDVGVNRSLEVLLPWALDSRDVLCDLLDVS